MWCSNKTSVDAFIYASMKQVQLFLFNILKPFYLIKRVKILMCTLSGVWAAAQFNPVN